MAKKIPPPLSALKSSDPKAPAGILHKPKERGMVVVHGQVLDRDKASPGTVRSNYKKQWQNTPKVEVEGGKLVGGKPPIAPRQARFKANNTLQQKCYCGCGREVAAAALFSRGHVRKLYAALGAIERGELLPNEALTPELVEILGPWVPRGLGHTPTNSLWDNR